MLVSERTRELAGVDARDLGHHQFKGLAEAERVYQVVGGRACGQSSPRCVPTASKERILPWSNNDGMRVVVAEDSVLLREGIARLLEDAGLEVVGQAGTADELMLKVRSYKPDVAIVDIRMPPTQTDEGLRAAKEIREQHPETSVLVLSQYLEAAYALELLSESAEGVGYLLKDRVADIDGFVAAVKRVGEGGSALDPSVVSQLVGRRRRGRPDRPAHPARARGHGADGTGPVEQRDRRAAGRDRARRREARDVDLREAPPRRGLRAPPPRVGGARVPARLGAAVAAVLPPPWVGECP